MHISSFDNSLVGFEQIILELGAISHLDPQAPIPHPSLSIHQA